MEPHPSWYATMSNPTVITHNGQTVECWGKWEEDSNCYCVFENENYDRGYYDGADNWTEVVEKMTAYAKRKGTILVELQAC